jgi:hypothetical protein
MLNDLESKIVAVLPTSTAPCADVRGDGVFNIAVAIGTTIDTQTHSHLWGRGASHGRA